ncbi:MAG TPA: ABC transporter permease [Planctomycetaceae bacterium]|nr:ABC transporter permease [Planctomycetaceae bacterium]
MTNETDESKFWQIVQSLGPLLALLLVTICFAVADQIWAYGAFTDVRNLRVVLVESSPVAVAGLGMTLIIIAGGIDLSAGTAAMLCTTVLAASLKAEYSIVLALAFTLIAAASCGMANGLLVGLLNIPPFIVTLGTMTIFLGLGKQLASNSTISVSSELVPQWLFDLTSTKPPHVFWGWLPRIPSGVVLALFIAALVAVLLRYSVLGRHIFAMGSNESTARLCGVNILKTKLLVYVLGGLLIGIAGIYSFSLVKMASPSEGVGRELKFIAAVVIGGGSLSGGRGSVLGTLAGALMMGVITSGCAQLEITNAIQDIMIGCIIIAAVTLDQLRVRRQEQR